MFKVKLLYYFSDVSFFGYSSTVLIASTNKQHVMRMRSNREVKN